MSCFTPRNTLRSSGFSTWSAMIVRPRSMVRPASIMVANWRAKTARSLDLIRFLKPRWISFCMPTFAGRTCSGT